MHREMFKKHNKNYDKKHKVIAVMKCLQYVIQIRVLVFKLVLPVLTRSDHVGCDRHHPHPLLCD